MTHLTRAQRLLIGHGALVLLFGFLAGFGFLFFLVGRIDVWPFPVIEVQVPGTYDAWRMAHMEGITNGFGLWILAVVLPILKLADKFNYWLSVGTIFTAWTFVIASILDPLFDNARGLVFTPDSTFLSDVAFFLFYAGIISITVVVVVIAYKALREPEMS